VTRDGSHRVRWCREAPHRRQLRLRLFPTWVKHVADGHWWVGGFHRRDRALSADWRGPHSELTSERSVLLPASPSLTSSRLARSFDGLLHAAKANTPVVA
jgi:hypothetical protein